MNTSSSNDEVWDVVFFKCIVISRRSDSRCRGYPKCLTGSCSHTSVQGSVDQKELCRIGCITTWMSYEFQWFSGTYNLTSLSYWHYQSEYRFQIVCWVWKYNCEIEVYKFKNLNDIGNILPSNMYQYESEVRLIRSQYCIGCFHRYSEHFPWRIGCWQFAKNNSTLIVRWKFRVSVL